MAEAKGELCAERRSTHAGMLVGFAKDGRSRNVIGIDASGTIEQTRAQVLAIARPTADLVELGREITDDDLVLIGDYAYPAYGVPSAETNDAIRLAARTEGMMTDPVYEGKSMQGMIDLVRRAISPRGRKCSTPILAACRRSTPTATFIGTAERVQRRTERQSVKSAVGRQPRLIAVSTIVSAPGARRVSRAVRRRATKTSMRRRMAGLESHRQVADPGQAYQGGIHVHRTQVAKSQAVPQCDR
jgi:hypothetical protein